MRRISLALALSGAIAASGCGGGAKSSDGQNPGIPGSTFTLTVNVWAGGTVKSQSKNASSVFVDDGKLSCTGLATCSADYPWGTEVRLIATTSGTNYFNGFAGDCQSYSPCDLTGNAEKSVIAMFTAKPESHPNWSGDSTVHPTKMAELNCMECHGSALQGIGIAPNCYQCHRADGTGGPVKQAAATASETCTKCHPQNIGTIGHQATYNKFTDGSATGGTVLSGAIDSVTATALTGADTGLFSITVKFSLAKNGTALTAAQYTALAQKRLSMTRYDPVAKKFYAVKYLDGTATKTVSFPAPTVGTDGLFTTTAAKAPFDPNAAGAPPSFLYFYFADAAIIPPAGHYLLPDNTISMARAFGTIDWTSTANASACTNCHGTPYAKHGYRQAVVAGLGDMVACKACHWDDRAGIDFNLAMTYDDPLEMARIMALPPVGGEPPWTPEVQALYGYTATTMADTHISHAKEFLYPQSMGNCVTCHAGKLDRILTDANFTGAMCKTCHPVKAAAGEDPKRAPKLEPAYHTIDWAKGVLLETDESTTPPTVTEMQCNECHNPTWRAPWNPAEGAPTFAQLHTGYNKKIYDASGTKYASAITTEITSASFASNAITFDFRVNGTAAGAIVKPTVVVSLYGYDTKDFIVGGHGSAADGKRNLEWAEAASGNSPRLTVTKNADGTWTAIADLSSFLAKYNDAAGANRFGTAIKRAELGVLPALGIDQSIAPNNNATNSDGTVNPNYNPYLAISGASRTFDLATGLVADAAVYGKDIVATAKCNKCHDALATEFHNPAYGSAGVVGCRLCHIVGSGGSHLEMQSRSIDSYVHALHSFQKMDVNQVDFRDPLGALQYEHHIGATYPNFTILNCESCHNAGKYDMPLQNRSLPGILSGSSTINKARAIGGVSTVVVGPASRACGGCHRAEAIKADDAAALGQLDQHAGTFGIREGVNADRPKIADVLDKVIAQLKAIFQ